MIDYDKLIDDAFVAKRLFFKPWVGTHYDDGILFKGANSSLKTLVIGASRYCKFSYKHQKDNAGCKFLDLCTNHCEYQSLMKVAEECAFIKMYDSTGHKYHFSDINSASILSKTEDTYTAFSDEMQPVIAGKLDNDIIWHHVSFINYYQGIVWGYGSDNIGTPTRWSPFEKEQYDLSEEIILSILKILQPEIIILWAPKTFMRNVDVGLFRNLDFVNFEKQAHRQYILTIDNRKIPLFLFPHPSRRKDKKMSSDLNSFQVEFTSFITERISLE